MTKLEYMKTLLKYDPHPKQKIFHMNEAKYRGFIGGLGSGKTAAGAIETVNILTKYPGISFLILAPTYPMLVDSTMPVFFKWCPEDFILKHNQSKKKIYMANGSVVRYRPCDNRRVIDKLRGIEIGGVWIDEASLVPYYAWKVAIGRLRQLHMPLSGFITTTPKGFGWLHKKFVTEPSINEKSKKKYFYIHATSYDNIHLPEDYLEDISEEYTGVFKQQEIMGEFVGHEGLVYSSFSRNIHVKKDFVMKKIKRMFCGLDWGFKNPRVCLWIGLDSDDRAYILYELYRKKMLLPEFIFHVKAINKIFKKHNPDTYYGDPSEPEDIETFNNAGLPCVGANNEVMAGIQEVSNYIEVREDGYPRLFIHERCVNTIMEFENYRYADTEEGKEEKEKPIKTMDHAMDALRYGLMSMKEKIVLGEIDLF